MLGLSDIEKSFRGPAGEVRALRGVTLELETGEFAAVRGPSGSGKSTLLHVAGGLLRPTSGRVALDGSDPYALSSEARSRWRAAHVGFVFQQFPMLPYLNVLDNVLVASVALPRSDAAERARELVGRLGLGDRIAHRPSELSVGERQRVGLARALLNRPGLVLADEPTGNLDPENALIVLDTLDRFALEGGTVLMVTHDERAAGRAERQLLLTGGTLDERRSAYRDAVNEPVPVPAVQGG